MKYNGIDVSTTNLNGKTYSNGLRNGNFMVTDIVTNGLVSWLDGNDYVSDASGYGWHDRTDIYPKYIKTSGSNGNSGVIFDGIDDYVNIYRIEDLQAAGGINYSAYTAEIYLTVPNITGTKTLLGRTQTNNAGYRWTIGLAGAFPIITYRAVVDYVTTDKSMVSSTPIDSVSKWHIVASSTSSGSSKIYINGVLVKSGATSSFISSQAGVSLMYDSFATPRYSAGTVYCSRLYSRVLTDAEVLQNYNATIKVSAPSVKIGSFLIGSKNIGEVV